MGWGSGVVQGKDVGYLVEAECEQAGCSEGIDRGLSFACGGYPGEDENSCAGHFCTEHLGHYVDEHDEVSLPLCEECGKLWVSGGE